MKIKVETCELVSGTPRSRVKILEKDNTLKVKASYDDFCVFNSDGDLVFYLAFHPNAMEYIVSESTDGYEFRDDFNCRIHPITFKQKVFSGSCSDYVSSPPMLNSPNVLVARKGKAPIEERITEMHLLLGCHQEYEVQISGKVPFKSLITSKEVVL